MIEAKPLKLILFQSTRDVIKLERNLSEKKIPFKVIPVPRSLSSECGMAIEIEEENIVYAEKIAFLFKIDLKIINRKEVTL